jgi:hypothetical protein
MCIAAVITLGGCANVKVMKVQVAPGEKEPEGIPFYLPRPYVQVYEPFVISSKAWLVGGRITPDGQFLHIDNAEGNLDGALAAKIAPGSGFPLAAVRITSPQALAAGANPSNDRPLDSTSADGKREPKVEAAGKPGANNEADPPAEAASPNGQFNMKVTQSSVPFPPTLGRRFFDVVWMPDFDEKYVFQGQPGLGNANVGVTMVQGWGLNGLDARLDNSALVQPLLDFYSTGLDVLSQLARSKILPAPAPALQGGAQPKSAVTDNLLKRRDDGRSLIERQQQLTAGTQVSVKVTKVKVAAPGLYPVLKPREVAEARDASNETLFIPNRPYTNVAFNTYEVLVVEAARSTGDSPMNLQRFFDVDVPGKAPSAPPQSEQSGTGK